MKRAAMALLAAAIFFPARQASRQADEARPPGRSPLVETRLRPERERRQDAPAMPCRVRRFSGMVLGPRPQGDLELDGIPLEGEECLEGKRPLKL